MHAKLGISVDTVATGLGNRFGNKGAVAISITVAGTTFMFVNSHFAAAEHCLETRNRDYHRINHELIARHSARAIVNQGKIGPMSRRSSLIATEDMHLADYFDYCFWVGDLNYRVVAPRSMADALIQQSDIKVNPD